MKISLIARFVFSVLLYIIGGGVGVYLWIVFDVNIALKELEGMDPASWPTMDPRNRFVFIPVFSALTAILGAAGSAIFYNFGWKINNLWSWLCVGFAYSTPFLILGVSRFWGLGLAALFCGFLMAIFLALIYHFFGER